MAKIAACDAGLAAADRALQSFGGSGYTDDTSMLQRFTYMRLLRTVPVARELALNHVATAGLGLPAPTDHGGRGSRQRPRPCSRSRSLVDRAAELSAAAGS